MGQSTNQKDLRGHHARNRFAGQTCFRFGLTLASALLVCLAPAQTTPAFSDSKAWDWLLKQVALGPRTPGSTGHIKCRDLILEEVRKYCDNPRVQEVRHPWSVTGKPVKMFNILGEQNWQDAKVRLVLLAHWDTRPTADQEFNATDRARPILGANDGASGAAVLLELMRVLKSSKLPIGIQYLFTDGEDLGPGLNEMFLGARAYAKSPGVPRPDYGILLDMIGDRDLRVPMEINGYQAHKSLVTALYTHAASMGLQDTFPMQFGEPIEDDHLPLIRAGIPTVDLIDFTYDSWHTLADTADKCSAASLGKVGRLLQSWVMRMPPFRP